MKFRATSFPEGFQYVPLGAKLRLTARQWEDRQYVLTREGRVGKRALRLIEHIADAPEAPSYKNTAAGEYLVEVLDKECIGFVAGETFKIAVT